jgi:hypothetical protein
MPLVENAKAPKGGGVNTLMYISGFEEALSCPLKSSLLIGGGVTLLSYLLGWKSSALYLGMISGGLTLAAKAKSGG